MVATFSYYIFMSPITKKYKISNDASINTIYPINNNNNNVIKILMVATEAYKLLRNAYNNNTLIRSNNNIY